MYPNTQELEALSKKDLESAPSKGNRSSYQEEDRTTPSLESQL